MKHAFGLWHQTTLSNGLKIVVNVDHAVPKVSTQLWYHVGSKNEKSGQRGLAHLLEHMIFKGTQRLSESDINLITSKLSGYTNAFTSYDYTGYIFDFPKQHWTAALDMFADCMVNCCFDEDMLQSELKAVVQELKLYKDDYLVSLMEVMIGNIFPDHPYHHPIIGYKQDLWSITREGLLSFYKTYYRPCNATLVVVGAVDYQEVVHQANYYFGSIASEALAFERDYYAESDVRATEATLYRDVQRPQLLYAWRVPGIMHDQEFIIAVVAHIVGESKTSLLYQRLVDQMHVATDVHMFFDDMFQHGVLFLQIEPVSTKVIDLIEKEIGELLAYIIDTGLEAYRVMSAIKQISVAHIAQAEELQDRAYIAGKIYLASGNGNYFDTYIQYDASEVKSKAEEFIKKYIRACVMHKGAILPLPSPEKKYWLALQKENDQLDATILHRKVRQTVVQPGCYVHKIHAKDPVPFDIPLHERYVLPNGLTVLCADVVRAGKVEIQISFDAQYYYDPVDLQGIGNFVFAVIQEGTKNYTKQEFMEGLAAKGMELDVSSARIGLTLLQEDLEFGLRMLYELVTNALFDEHAIEKIRQHIESEIIDYWDSPSDFVKQLAREHVYQDSVYAQHPLGTIESINRITKNDLLVYYHQRIIPGHTRIALVGVTMYDAKKAVIQHFGQWQTSACALLIPPVIIVPPVKTVIHPIVRDQVVLAFAGLSVAYNHPYYDALLLFDQIFTGGLQHSMSSRLFQLREQTGLFYSIGGSLVYGSAEQPGLFFIQTMVSQDRLEEAQKAIMNAINHALDDITDEEIIIAKNAIAHNIIDQYETQKGIAENILFIDKMHLQLDYMKMRMNVIKHIDRAQIVKAVSSILHADNISSFKVGRF